LCRRHGVDSTPKTCFPFTSRFASGSYTCSPPRYCTIAVARGRRTFRQPSLIGLEGNGVRTCVGAGQQAHGVDSTPNTCFPFTSRFASCSYTCSPPRYCTLQRRRHEFFETMMTKIAVARGRRTFRQPSLIGLEGNGFDTENLLPIHFTLCFGQLHLLPSTVLHPPARIQVNQRRDAGTSFSKR
jgi:hypothetical protein